jgi:hypothetical protein
LLSLGGTAGRVRTNIEPDLEDVRSRDTFIFDRTTKDRLPKYGKPHPSCRRSFAAHT